MTALVGFVIGFACGVMLTAIGVMVALGRKA